MSGTCLPTTVAAAAPRLSGLPPAGFGNTFRHTKHANAYMLVYVRESEWDAVMCQVTEQEISAHVRARLKVRGGDGSQAAGWVWEWMGWGGGGGGDKTQGWGPS